MCSKYYEKKTLLSKWSIIVTLPSFTLCQWSIQFTANIFIMSKMENKFISWVNMYWKRSHTFHSPLAVTENINNFMWFNLIFVLAGSYWRISKIRIFPLKWNENTSDFSPSSMYVDVTSVYPFILLNSIKSNLIRFVRLRWIRINHVRWLFVVVFWRNFTHASEMASRRFDASHCRVLFLSPYSFSLMSIYFQLCWFAYLLNVVSSLVFFSSFFAST